MTPDQKDNEDTSLMALNIAIENLQNQENFKIGIPFQRDVDNVDILTDLECRMNNGGIRRGRILVMLPRGQFKTGTRSGKKSVSHFVAIRRTAHAETPSSKDDAFNIQEYHLNGESLEKDHVFMSDQNHDAIQCSLSGMYYFDKHTGLIKFNPFPDLFPLVNYDVYAPDADVQNIIINSKLLQMNETRFRIGYLKQSEGDSIVDDYEEIITPVYALHRDFYGTNTGIFGKIGYGKSNVIKKIVINMHGKIGQLIFDMQGEYSKRNKNDGNHHVAKIIPAEVFGLKNEAGQRSVLYNFYKYPKVAHALIANIIPKSITITAHYVTSYLNADVPAIEELKEQEDVNDWGQRCTLEKKLKIFWMILHKAGFPADVSQVPDVTKGHNSKCGKLSPGVRWELRLDAYQFSERTKSDQQKRYHARENLPTIDDWNNLETELDVLWKYFNSIDGDQNLLPEQKQQIKDSLFDTDTQNLLGFLFAGSGRSGAKILRSALQYHDPDAAGIEELLKFLVQKKTCIVNFGGRRVRSTLKKLYTELITKEIFDIQSEEFNSEDDNPQIINLYYEEAHELFPKREKYEKEDEQSIYTTVAKEGRKCGIGIVYATQSTSDVDDDLLNQTVNILAFHMSSLNEVQILGRVETLFKEHAIDINKTVSTGYARMKLKSTDIVIPVEADDYRIADPTFRPKARLSSGKTGGNE